MSTGYYDPHPVLSLDRPVCLIGFIGSETEMVGRLLTSVTGLRFTLIDELAEHAVATTRGDFWRTRGEARLREIERKVVQRALADRPAGVIVLGDGNLLDRGTLHAVRRQSTMVHLHRPIEALVPRIRSSKRDRPELDAVRTEGDLRALLRARAAGYAGAHLRVDGDDRSPLAIAKEVARRLDWPVWR